MLHSSHGECMIKSARIAFVLLCGFLICGAAGPLYCSAQTRSAQRGSTKVGSSGEARAAAAMERARAEGPLALDAFLRRMPKGADLHMHLSGAVYAETFIRDAADDSLCVNL